MPSPQHFVDDKLAFVVFGVEGTDEITHGIVIQSKGIRLARLRLHTRARTYDDARTTASRPASRSRSSSTRRTCISAARQDCDAAQYRRRW